jgi:hypothetical protein
MRFLTALSFVAIAATVFACSTSSGDGSDDNPATNDSTNGENDLRGVKHCGGIAALACSAGQTCVDDPIDSCDPANGGRDCSGICVDAKSAPKCGGLAGIPCASGLRCVDDPSDGCDPAKGGADCGGICVKAACDPKLALTVTCMAGLEFDQQQCKCVKPAAKVSCLTLTCAQGNHCEMKGINGGAIPVCIKDNNTDCRQNGCNAGQWCSACWGSFACIPNGAMC